MEMTFDYFMKVYGIYVVIALFLIVIVPVVWWWLTRPRITRVGSAKFWKEGDKWWWSWRGMGKELTSQYVFQSIDGAKADLREKLKEKGLRFDD